MSLFFTRRRRNRTVKGDWSSDVCSSDLTTSSLSVVETSISRLTLPPAFTDSVWSSTERTGLVAAVVVGGGGTVGGCGAGGATAPVAGAFGVAGRSRGAAGGSPPP